MWYIRNVADNQTDFRCTINFIADSNEKMTQNGCMSKTFYPELLCLPHIIISQLCCNKDSLSPLLFCTTCTLFDTVNKGIYYTIVNHLVRVAFVRVQQYQQQHMCCLPTLYFNQLSHKLYRNVRFGNKRQMQIKILNTWTLLYLRPYSSLILVIYAYNRERSIKIMNNCS